MHRTQIYLGEALHHHLSVLSRRTKTTISELIRRAAEKVYGKRFSPQERLKALQAVRGMWKDRKDLPSTEEYVRSLRRDTRAKRLGLPT
jgi:hypothetical protein